MNILIATTNPNKIKEIRPILSDLPIKMYTLDKYPGIKEPEESGQTFAENARDKAIHYSTLSEVLTVAEDSGLEIDALDGEPGVLSARFNGDSYEKKFEAIYEQLKARNATLSTARFVCSLAVADHKKIIFEASGTIEGQIAKNPNGNGGFGYDPIFFYPPYGQTLASVSTEAKEVVSHRGKAFRLLRTFLKTSLLNY